jgi:hypothetical protein
MIDFLLWFPTKTLARPARSREWWPKSKMSARNVVTTICRSGEQIRSPTTPTGEVNLTQQ